MSTSQPAPSGEKDGLSKVLSRMRTVFRRASSTTKHTKKTPAPAQPEPSKAPATQPKQPNPAVETSGEAHAESTMQSDWGALQEEKARLLFAKYGLTLEPGEWRTASNLPVQRVTKPIRMRVRRTCHRCQTTFGPDKVCVNCQHVRCKKCPRHPPAKPKDGKDGKERQDRTETALQTILAQRAQPVQPRPSGHKLTLPSRTGGQDLVRKPVQQRVRRTCHRCETVFAAGATECASCRHIRCKSCPRDPPKLHKYADGYPGDVEPPHEPPARTWKKPRQRVRYTCHICMTLFQPGEPSCSNCGEAKGPRTIRDPPKKQKPEPDPEIVRRVEERLANLRVSA
ncbi:hypothetical protein BJX61DRAFT_263075 [Aspergillus egyptiacus]|nr:hypothetical protein BJX61DRAFT_263075 [Aspergillus egyptiacus]